MTLLQLAVDAATSFTGYEEMYPPKHPLYFKFQDKDELKRKIKEYSDDRIKLKKDCNEAKEFMNGYSSKAIAKKFLERYEIVKDSKRV